MGDWVAAQLDLPSNLHPADDRGARRRC
jgi:hypothetical protein